jgi:hypothetical protein
MTAQERITRAQELNAMGRGAIGLWTRVNRAKCAADAPHYRYVSTANGGRLKVDVDLGPCKHFPEAHYPNPKAGA